MAFKLKLLYVQQTMLMLRHLNVRSSRKEFTVSIKKTKAHSPAPEPDSKIGAKGGKAQKTRKIPAVLKSAPSMSNDLIVVGIGASAGGLEAFKHVLPGLPVDAHMAFVIVQHLDPKLVPKVPPEAEAPKDIDLTLIMFEEIAPVAEKVQEALSEESAGDPRLLELEQELTAAREHLQTTVEELETTNEEVQSLNEELQSANEELQSANEELTMVNEELQVNSSEPAEANTDLQNILKRSGMATVIVNKELKITRFTPTVGRFSQLTASDCGQVITTNARKSACRTCAELIFGHSGEKAAGQNITLLQPEPYRSEHDRYIKNHLETGKGRVIGIGRKVEGGRSNGQTFPMGLTVTEMWVNAQRKFVGIVRDLSDRRMIQPAE
jgi:PAS domain S-box-containing protein